MDYKSSLESRGSSSPLKDVLSGKMPSPMLMSLGIGPVEEQVHDDEDVKEGFFEDQWTLNAMQDQKKELQLLEGLKQDGSALINQVRSFGFTIQEDDMSEEASLAGKWLHRACARRRKYRLPQTPVDPNVVPVTVLKAPNIRTDDMTKSSHLVEMSHGVLMVYRSIKDKAEGTPIANVPDVTEFVRDLRATLRTVNSAPIKSLSHARLHLLEAKFKLHILLNDGKESQEQKKVPHRDFYNVRKVDTHVHHSSCMHQKHLLRFIRKKLRTDADTPVLYRDGKLLTLQQVFESLNMNAYDLSIDTLDVHADRTLFHRFDRFNLKYNPFGQSRLREVFLKHDNYIHGSFLADLTHEIFDDLDEDKYQMSEPRISIYGRDKQEWTKLSRWIVTNNLIHPNVRWLIQIPRLAHLILSQGIVASFEEMLDNIFRPLVEVTIDPSIDPNLHAFLQSVVAFDSVDDESVNERKMLHDVVDPSTWTQAEPVPYSYCLYYMWVNICMINNLRLERGLNTFAFRPHCGEAGDIDHLAVAFLLADGINHGITLKKSPVLEYLYYLEQIGIAMSPMSNNALFVSVEKNPFYRYFCRGLNVSLSTDDPMQFHHTHEPLIEEYAMAKQVWRLSNTDLCEIARNSVLQSGFEHEVKAYFIGSKYWLGGVEGNNITRTNVPNLRMAFRHDLLCYEQYFIERAADLNANVKSTPPTFALAVPDLPPGNIRREISLIPDLWPGAKSAASNSALCLASQ